MQTRHKVKKVKKPNLRKLTIKKVARHVFILLAFLDEKCLVVSVYASREAAGRAQERAITKAIFESQKKGSRHLADVTFHIIKKRVRAEGEHIVKGL